MVVANINFTPKFEPGHIGEEDVSAASATSDSSETNTISYNIMQVSTAKTLKICVS